jgi:F0F1-type ATP synthase membrane subunit b/b'
MLLQRLGVIDIFAILIYVLYKKKNKGIAPYIHDRRNYLEETILLAQKMLNVSAY